MKTILLTMSRGGTARNILQTDAYKILKDSGERLVIVTPAYNDERFIKEFSADNVFFEPLIELKSWSTIDHILVGLHMAIVYNRSSELWDRYGIYDKKEGSWFKCAFKKMLFKPLSFFPWLKDFLRFLDERLVRDSMYTELFDKYKPDLVFSTSVMEDADVYILKQARQRKIPTIGMVKTWDNTSKMNFRVKVDKLLVWSQYVKDESIRFQNYLADDVVIVGIPQFDFYVDPNYLARREDFFREIGADPKKQLIVFGSEGKISAHDGDIANIIVSAIDEKKLKLSSQLFIRPHFMYPDDVQKFSVSASHACVILDREYNHSKSFKDNWDYSKQQIRRLTNILYHADILITSASTLLLDGSAFDTPMIAIGFDGYVPVPKKESISKWYESEYMKTLMDQKGVEYVTSDEQLISSINQYFENRDMHALGRKRMRDYMCYKIDGKAGERIGRVVLQHLDKN